MKNKENYSKDWNDIIRPLALKKHNYKCNKCRVKHRDIGYYDFNKVWISCDSFMIDYAKKIGFKIQTIYLQIHHKDGNTQNNQESNLHCYCPKCHLKIEKELNKFKKLIKNIWQQQN